MRAELATARGGQVGSANIALHWMVSKAEPLGLAFDRNFLSHYMACYNSALHDSMSGNYRILGQQLRDIRDYYVAGVGVHPSLGDRMRHGPSNYAPRNVLDTFGKPCRMGLGTRLAKICDADALPCRRLVTRIPLHDH